MKVVFIGGGNMATALISGLLEKGSSPSDLLVVDVAQEAREKFEVMQISTAPNFIDSDVRGMQGLFMEFRSISKQAIEEMDQWINNGEYDISMKEAEERLYGEYM